MKSSVRFWTGVVVATLLAWLSTVPAETAASQGTGVSNPRYQVAVADLMILKRQKLGAFQLAKDLGADGVEVDMGGLGNRETFDNQLTNAATRQQFLDKARELGLEIPSLAMTGFFAQSFAERPTVPRMIQDCVDTMTAMNVKVAFLPLGVECDLQKKPEQRPRIVERLKLAGEIAAKAGVVIGVETSLSAAEEVKLLADVASPGVKIYFNFSNAVKNGRDIPTELRVLGKDRICQIHATNEDGVWLENDPKIDLPKIKQTLDEMGWSGWLVIERSRDANDPRNVKRNFSANTAHLKKVFQGGLEWDFSKLKRAEIIPSVAFDNVPLSIAVRNLAQQGNINAIIDPYLSWRSLGKARGGREPMVTRRWYSITARQALEDLLITHDLKPLEDPATTVIRIVHKDFQQNPTTTLAEFGATTNVPIPLIVMENVPIVMALENLAKQAGVKIVIDDRVGDSFRNPAAKEVMYIRWTDMTAVQALAALIDSHGLIVRKAVILSEYHISVRKDRPR